MVKLIKTGSGLNVEKWNTINIMFTCSIKQDHNIYREYSEQAAGGSGFYWARRK